MVISACRGLFALYIGEFGLLFYFLFALVISILLTYFFVSLVRIYENKMKRGLFFGYKDAVFQDIDNLTKGIRFSLLTIQPENSSQIYMVVGKMSTRRILCFRTLFPR